MSQSLFNLCERLGIFVIIEASILSGTSAIFILCYALYRLIRTSFNTWRRKDLQRPRQRPSDATNSILFLNLMAAELIQASGNIANFRWMIVGAVVEGRLCTSQAVLKQIGIVGVSLTSLAIAFHTFFILVLRWKIHRNVPKYTVVCIWVCVALIIGTPNAIYRNELYYGDTGFWCWISSEFPTERIMTEYFWVWLCGFFMIVLYTIMFAVVRRWIVISYGIRWYNKPWRSALDVQSEDEKKMNSIANSMLYYPAVYIFCVFPNTMSRWLSFSRADAPPYQAILFANAIFALSGMFNLVLYFLTRPKIVVGPVVPKDVLPIHLRRESTWVSSQKIGCLSPYDHGILSTNVEGYSRQDSSLEPKSPSRTINRPRSSYELQSVPSPLSPTRTTHYHGASLQIEEVVDICPR